MEVSMKKYWFVFVAVLFLAAMLALPQSSASAASNSCVSNPTSGPPGTVFTVTCAGFVPNEMFTFWMTEPDGHAFAAPIMYGPADSTYKASSGGLATVVVYSQGYGGSVSLALGTWAVTMKGSSNIAIGTFTVTGGTKGVSGASLSADAKGLVTGSGFAPGEQVSVWVDFPNGDCSGEWNIYDTFFGNIPGLSNIALGNIKASAGGTFAFQFLLPFNDWCRGTYHIVARGMTSGLGADTWWTTPNGSITENATLVATPSSVVARGGLITFTGTGYDPNSQLNCWETSPQGQAIPSDAGKTDSAGNVTISFHTGTGTPDGFYLSSEGALGQWYYTCRDGAGNTGIAPFWVYGDVVDP
jgi:hypothetical protein